MQIGHVGAYVQPLALRGHTPGAATPTGAVGATDSFRATLAGVAAGTTTAIDDAQRYAPRPGNTLTYLTPADRQMLAAATGFEVSSDGVVQNPGRKPVHPLILQVATDRQNGRLQGDVTEAYLTEVFKTYRDDDVMGSSFTDDVLSRALDHLANQRQRRADGVILSSFNMRA
jgi:hypothetical protein